MRYEIVLAPEAHEDLQDLKANVRADVRDAIEHYLRHHPNQVSKSRIKRLVRPQFRLRVSDDIRVFYDMANDTVEILAIVTKSEADEWLERHGEANEEGGSV